MQYIKLQSFVDQTKYLNSNKTIYNCYILFQCTHPPSHWNMNIIAIHVSDWKTLKQFSVRNIWEEFNRVAWVECVAVNSYRIRECEGTGLYTWNRLYVTLDSCTFKINNVVYNDQTYNMEHWFICRDSVSNYFPCCHDKLML